MTKTRPCIKHHPDPGPTQKTCRLCWLALNHPGYQAAWGLPVTATRVPPRGEAVPQTQFTPAGPVAGPGTELKLLLDTLGVRPREGCACKSRMTQMNQWGVAGCEQNRDEIIRWLKDEAGKTRGWEKVKAAARAVVHGILLDPLNVEGSLLDYAVHRARKKEAAGATAPAAGPAPPTAGGVIPRQFGLYIVTNQGREALLAKAKEYLAESDWDFPITVVTNGPPNPRPDWNRSSRDYYQVLDRAVGDGHDHVVILEDDCRVGYHFRQNLEAWGPYRTGQLDFASLYTPDTVYEPFVHTDPVGGYALPNPQRLSGPNDAFWMRHRLYGSQCYVLSREFARFARDRWLTQTGGQDARMITLAQYYRKPMWWAVPGLVQHDPTVTNFNTPPHYDRGFRPDGTVQPGPCYIASPDAEGALGWDEQFYIFRACANLKVCLTGTHGSRVRPCVAQVASEILEDLPGDVEIIAGESITRDQVFKALARARCVMVTRYPDPWVPDARAVVFELLNTGVARVTAHVNNLVVLADARG